MTPSSVRAWLLELGGDRLAAVALHELVEVLSRPRRFHVPLAYPTCHEVIVWRDEILPVVDLRPAAGSATRTGAASVTAVAAYQLAPGQRVRHGAVELNAMPKTIEVSDEMSCPPPGSGEPLGALALACFSYQNLPVPVVDLARLFEEGPAA
ncbi:MAG: chemotaxis protein CheW [Gammaproteobacteria bacterium]|nr:chemotaxis protein CheW [Gammaproteobacteria bacterium]